MKITESILAVILVTSKYENRFLLLSYTANTTVSVKFDFCELRQISPWTDRQTD